MKLTYSKPTSQAICLEATSMLASSTTVNVVNDDSKTVNKDVDLWSNKREGNPIWDNMSE